MQMGNSYWNNGNNMFNNNSFGYSNYGNNMFGNNDIMSQLKYRYQYIVSNIGDQLRNMIANNAIDQMTASAIMDHIQANIAKYEEHLCRLTNNYQTFNTNGFLQWMAQAIESTYNIITQNRFRNMSYNDNMFNTMASANSFSNNTPVLNRSNNPNFHNFNTVVGNNCNNEFNIPDNIWNDPDNSYWASVPMHLRPKHVREKNMEKMSQISKVQNVENVNYENNNNTSINNNSQNVENKYSWDNDNQNNDQVVQDKSVKLGGLEEVSLNDDNDEFTMIKFAKQLASIEFDPDDKTTWPLQLVDEYFKLDKSNHSDSYKQYFAAMAVGKEYWKNKGIEWEIKDSCIDIHKTAKEIEKKKEHSPRYFGDSKKTVDHSNLDVITETGKLFGDMSADEIYEKPFVYSSKNIEPVKILFANYRVPDIVANDIDIIKKICDGSLKNAELCCLKNNENDEANDETSIIPSGININETFVGIVFGYNYFTPIAFDIPYEMMQRYYNDIRKIIKKYGNDNFVNFDKMYKEFINYNYNHMIRSHSCTLEKYLITKFNEAIFRNLRSIHHGANTPPIISKYENIIDLLEENKYSNKYNVLINKESFRDILKRNIIEILIQTFSGKLLDSSDVNIIEESENLQEMISKYNPSDDYGKFEYDDISELEKWLYKFSVISVMKRFVITDIHPTKNIDSIEKGVPEMTDGKTANDLFHSIIIEEIQNFSASTNLLLLSDDSSDKPYVITNAFKLMRSIDKYIGYVKM